MLTNLRPSRPHYFNNKRKIMCFVKSTKSNKKPRPQKAKKDIVVYKAITKAGWGVYQSLRIDGKREKWVPGTHYWEDTPFKSAYQSDLGYIEVNGDAFHSCKTEQGAKNHGYNTVQMIIPKGAKYYSNGDEYVSSDIIYPKK